MSSPFDYMVVSLQPQEKRMMSLFVAAAKKRVGRSNCISLGSIVKGFASKGYSVTRSDIKRLCYQAQARDVVERLIYDGDNIYIAETDEELHAYVKALKEWASTTGDPRLKQILETTAKAITRQINGHKDAGSKSGESSKDDVPTTG